MSQMAVIGKGLVLYPSPHFGCIVIIFIICKYGILTDGSKKTEQATMAINTAVSIAPVTLRSLEQRFQINRNTL